MSDPEDERDPMLLERRRSQAEYYAMFKSKLKNRICLYFCIGFILSAILAVSAYLLSYHIWITYLVQEEGSGSNVTTSTLPTTTTTIMATTSENEARSTKNLVTTTTLMTTTSPEDVCQRRIVGYYSHWESATLNVNQIEKLTHLVYMFGFIQPDGSVRIDNGDSPALEKRFLNMQKVISGAGRKDLKVMVAVGGHFSDNTFASTLANPQMKERLLTSTIELLDKYNIDGIEVHWTYPLEKDGVQHAKLIKELRQRMTKLKISNGRSEDYVLSTVTSRYKQNRENILYSEIVNDVDFVTVIPYDWTKLHTLAGPIAPLYGFDEDSVDEAIRDVTCKTKEPSKLNLGVNLFGIHWNNVSFPLNDKVNQMYTKNDGGRTSHSYVFGRDNHKPGDWVNAKPSWHEKSRTPYIWDAKDRVFVSFENARSLEEKSSYAWTKNLGGMTVYVLEQDPKNIMIDAASSVEKCLRLKQDSVQFDCPT